MEDSLSFSMAQSPVPDISATVKTYGKRLLGFIKGKVRSNEDAEDILQEVWFQLSHLADLSELESISGWLYQVARNKVTDLYRKRKPESLESLGMENKEGEMFFRDFFFAEERSPEMAQFKELFWEELMMALDELPENQRQVFVLNEMEDMTLQEIADLQAEKLKTVISRKGYAVKHLRKRLDYLYNELNNL